ncbi:MAG: helix-turn-helix transcriptional regulator [Bacteroidota bacterium]
MSDPKVIPQVSFSERQRKAFEFEVLFSKDLLERARPENFNPYRPYRISFYALLFIVKGEGEHIIDFKRYAYRPGSIIFISREQVHAFVKNEELEAYFLIFTEAFLEKSSLGSNLMQQLSLYHYHLFSPVLQLKEGQFRLFLDLILHLKKEYEAPDDFVTEEIMQSGMKVILCLAERIRRANSEQPSHSFYHKEFIRFRNLLHHHVKENRKVKFYADTMSVSTKKLNRITNEIIQRPAKAFISEVLMMEIKRLLMNTSLSIKEIAYQTGFDAPTNFVKFFRNYAGQTPADFRKQFWNVRALD